MDDDASRGRMVLEGKLNQTPDMSGYTIINLTSTEKGYIRAYIDALRQRIEELENNQCEPWCSALMERQQARISQLEEGLRGMEMVYKNGATEVVLIEIARSLMEGGSDE